MNAAPDLTPDECPGCNDAILRVQRTRAAAACAHCGDTYLPAYASAAPMLGLALDATPSTPPRAPSWRDTRPAQLEQLLRELGWTRQLRRDDDPLSVVPRSMFGGSPLASMIARSNAAAAASASLKEKVENEKTLIDLMGIFNGMGFPGSLVPQLIKEWGVAAPQIVRDDPFRMLFAEMAGCGFARVDHLHHKLGHPHTSPRRQMALAWSKVNDNNDGHTWLSEEDLSRRIADELGADCDPDYAVQQAIDHKNERGEPEPLLQRRTSPDGSRWIALPARARAELDIAVGLAAMLAVPPSVWPDAAALPAIDDHQKERLAVALSGSVGILTGTPGTGKTFVAAQVIKAVQFYVPPDEIAVVAPTGKASVRITKALHEYGVSIEATTIHRLLGIAGQDRDGFRFSYNEHNKLPFRVVFMDEGSMTDCDLFAALVRALAPGTHLLVIGDPYQLPPVGHGAPLRDLIDAGVPCGELTEIRRNSGLIVSACRDIKDGFRYTTCEKFDDAGNNFRSIEAGTNNEVLDTIRGVCRKLKEKAATEPSLDPIEDVQVLCVVNAQSVLGRHNLNKILQEELNPHGQGGDQHPFRVGDKVICLKNGRMAVMDCSPGAKPDEFDGYFKTSAERKERYVANGDMGRVLAVAPKKIIVRFTHPDRVVEVGLPGAGKVKAEDSPDAEGGGWGPVDLGYSVTTHKSQGSEWPYVLIPIDESDRAKRVVSRELLYTAISRAKKRCILIGRRAVADEWCQTVVMRKRKTFLTDRTRQVIERMKGGAA
jgi:exodeoxyribonuclease V alpha subunit